MVPMSLGERAAYALIDDEFCSTYGPADGLKAIIGGMRILDKNQLMISAARIHDLSSIEGVEYDSGTLKVEAFRHSGEKRFSLRINGREVPFARTRRRPLGYGARAEILPCMIPQAEEALDSYIEELRGSGKGEIGEAKAVRRELARLKPEQPAIEVEFVTNLWPNL
jgi:hypothetical protein